MTGILPATPPSGARIGRDEGARIAREELSDPLYGTAEPGLLDRITGWVSEWLDRLGRQVQDVVPGGWWVLAPLLVVLAALLVALILYARPARGARSRAVIDAGAPLTAADHRRAAEEHAADERYAEAVRERLRALTRDLEERAVITPRPGRTATELAAETSAALPNRRAALYEAARVFNDIAYGQRPATAGDYRILHVLDEELRETRPAQNTEQTR